MKIAILTQPLHSNYGGLLQAWALQRTLTRLGHQVIILNRTFTRKPRPFWRRILSRMKHEWLTTTGKRKHYIKVTESLRQISEQYVRKFRDNRYLGLSPVLNSEDELHRYVDSQDFDAFVVGSDQVWRPKYSPHLMTFFLDFVKNDNTVKKIAYAASFGVDEWEFSEEQTKQAAALAPLFDIITVRESSGVKLVADYLKCKATHVLDPTMLLDKEDYIELVNNPTCQLKKSEGELFSYVLDTSEYLSAIITKCSEATKLKPYYCNYTIPVNRLRPGDKKEECVVPPVEQWLKSFMDAKMVITDSFHGVVFSIIFNKPFWVIANISRGAARFTSILKQFNLEERIVNKTSDIDWSKSIDWNKVNSLRNELKKKSLSILFNNLQFKWHCHNLK